MVEEASVIALGLINVVCKKSSFELITSPSLTPFLDITYDFEDSAYFEVGFTYYIVPK